MERLPPCCGEGRNFRNASRGEVGEVGRIRAPLAPHPGALCRGQGRRMRGTFALGLFPRAFRSPAFAYSIMGIQLCASHPSQNPVQAWGYPGHPCACPSRPRPTARADPRSIPAIPAGKALCRSEDLGVPLPTPTGRLRTRRESPRAKLEAPWIGVERIHGRAWSRDGNLERPCPARPLPSPARGRVGDCRGTPAPKSGFSSREKVKEVNSSPEAVLGHPRTARKERGVGAPLGRPQTFLARMRDAAGRDEKEKGGKLPLPPGLWEKLRPRSRPRVDPHHQPQAGAGPALGASPTAPQRCCPQPIIKTL